jgi:hypothetical protein
MVCRIHVEIRKMLYLLFGVFDRVIEEGKMPQQESRFVLKNPFFFLLRKQKAMV